MTWLLLLTLLAISLVCAFYGTRLLVWTAAMATGIVVLAATGSVPLLSLVAITLFVPCIANFFVMIKERGLRTAVAMAAVIVAIALGVGGALNWALRATGVLS